MARAQTWTRNISKKVKAAPAPARPRLTQAIVNSDALEGLKRRAEDLGLIIHARPGRGRKPTRKKGGGK